MCGQLRMGRAWVLSVVAGTLLATGGPTAAEDVSFPDANLEAAVRAELGIPAPTPITVADMLGLTALYASSQNISNIQGLQYATNLTVLKLWYNPISDISAIAGLTNLTNLRLDHNQISDISAMAGLTNLNYLYLDRNQISDISAVAGLTNLTQLYLYDNQISDISVVAGLTNLAILDLQENQISDISAVAGLTKFESLHLGNNQIEIMNLSSADLSYLHWFSIESNPLTNVLLVDVTLSQRVFNALMDGRGPSLTGIAELPGVLTLDMSGVDFANVSDLSAMYTMDDLEELSLSTATNLDGGQVVSLTGELDSLAWLDVTGLWGSFDAGTQSSLNSWDALEGNTLVTGEPLAVSALLDVAWVYQNTPLITQDRHMAVLTISVDDDPNGNSQYETLVIRLSGPGDVTCQATADPLVWEIVGSRRGDGAAGEVTLQVLVDGVDVGGEGATTKTLTVRLLGDVDGNGGAEPGDVQLLINELNGLPNPEGIHVKAFDIDANGGAEPGDVQVLMNVLNGLPVP